MANGCSKYLAAAVLCLCTSLAVAQYQVKVSALTHDIKDLSQRNSNVLDQNGEHCALIKFETPIPALFSFSLGAQQIEKRENKDDEVWIWVSADVKKMTVRCQDCTPQKDYRVALKAGNVYRAKITTGLPQETSTHQNINICCEQTPYYISIDGAAPVLSEQKNYYAELPIGAHEMTITAKLYKPYSASFRLLRSKAYSDTVRLADNYGEIIINANQSDFTVAVDEEQQANRTVVRVEPGSHKLMVMKERYETFETTVDVRLHEKKNVTATLKPAFALFTVTTSDEETEIWIDGKFRGRNRAVAELDWGEHQIEGRRDGYDTWEYPSTDFNVNSAKTIRIPKLNQQFATVRISVYPSDALIFIDGKPIDYQGSAYVNTRMTTGLHYLNIRLTDYKSMRDSFTLHAGQVYARDFALEHLALGETTLRTDNNIAMFRVSPEGERFFLGHTLYHGKLPAGENILELKNSDGITCQYRIFLDENLVNPPILMPYTRKFLVRSNTVGGTLQLQNENGSLVVRPNRTLKLAPGKYDMSIRKRGYHDYSDSVDLTRPYEADVVYRARLFKETDSARLASPKRQAPLLFQKFYDRSGTWYLGIVDFGYTFSIADTGHVVTFGVLPFRYKMFSISLVDFEFCASDSLIKKSFAYNPKVALVVPCAQRFAFTFYGGFSFNVYDSSHREAVRRSYILGGVSMLFNSERHFPIQLFADYKWPLVSDLQPDTGKEKLFRVGVNFSVGIDH